MLASLARLAHNVFIHPAVGVLHFAGDCLSLLHVPGPAIVCWRIGDWLHEQTRPSEG